MGKKRTERKLKAIKKKVERREKKTKKVKKKEEHHGEGFHTRQTLLPMLLGHSKTCTSNYLFIPHPVVAPSTNPIAEAASLKLFACLYGCSPNEA